jgi:hypothetical protein
MPYTNPKNLEDPQQIRAHFRRELEESWFKNHPSTLEYRERLLDLLVKKELWTRQPNNILWTRPDKTRKVRLPIAGTERTLCDTTWVQL